MCMSPVSPGASSSQEFKKGAYCVAVGTDYRNEDCKDVIIYEGMNTKGKQNDQDPGKPGTSVPGPRNPATPCAAADGASLSLSLSSARVTLQRTWRW